LFVLLILAHERRRVVHIAVTDHPTAAWTAQQLREALPWDEAPKYLVHDRDTVFHAWATNGAGDRARRGGYGRSFAVAERVRRAIDRIHSRRIDPISRSRCARRLRSWAR